MSRRYETAAAPRAPLDDRLRERAQRIGRDPNWLRRRLAFTRSTRDVDLVINPGLVADPADRGQLHEALVDALLTTPTATGSCSPRAAPAGCVTTRTGDPPGVSR